MWVLGRLVGVAELRCGVRVTRGLGIHPGSVCPRVIFCRKDVSTRSTSYSSPVRAGLDDRRVRVRVVGKDFASLGYVSPHTPESLRARHGAGGGARFGIGRAVDAYMLLGCCGGSQRAKGLGRQGRG